MPHASRKNKTPPSNHRYAIHIPFVSVVFRIVLLFWASILEILKDSVCPAHFPLQVQIILGLYRLIMMGASPLITFVCKKFGKKHPRWLEGIGFYTGQRPEGTLIWIHAPGLEELQASLTLMQHIQNKAPDTSFLLTGRQLDETSHLGLPPRTLLVMWPIDTPFFTERFLDHWKPDAACILKQELWPNLLISIHHHEIPIILLDFNISPIILKLWALLGKTLPTLLELFNGIWMCRKGPAYTWGVAKGLVRPNLMPALHAGHIHHKIQSDRDADEKEQGQISSEVSDFLDTLLPILLPEKVGNMALGAGEQTHNSLH